MTSLTRDAVIAALEDVKDPEIPFVSIVELGIVQSVEVSPDTVTVAITPTWSGCPALELMRTEIAERVRALGARHVEVPLVLSPPWSSDRIAPEARERMRAIGLAPPPPAPFRADDALSLTPVEPEPAACPFCGSEDTVVENPFGPTICRTLHYCNACQQPFESFKAL